MLEIFQSRARTTKKEKIMMPCHAEQFDKQCKTRPNLSKLIQLFGENLHFMSFLTLSSLCQGFKGHSIPLIDCIEPVHLIVSNAKVQQGYQRLSQLFNKLRDNRQGCASLATGVAKVASLTQNTTYLRQLSPGLTQVCSILRQWRNFCDTCRKAGAALPIMRQG